MLIPQSPFLRPGGFAEANETNIHWLMPMVQQKKIVIGLYRLNKVMAWDSLKTRKKLKGYITAFS
jgi:hypothetical protein